MRLFEFSQEHSLTESDNPVTGAITRRILLQRADLLQKYGPVKVGQAIDEVADFVGDVEEIGSSDVSGWVKHVEQMLGNMGDEVDEAGTLDRYRDRIGTSGQSDRYRDSQEIRHERNQEYDDASHQSRLNRMSADDQNYANWRQNQSDRDAHRTSRMQKDDDDWEKTFDMMRDRLNRYQWSSQRDVDPEQLAAISNIKYDPKKKNEAVQAKTDDKLLAYYAQRKAEEEKKKKEQQGVAEAGPYGSRNPDTMSPNNYDRYQQDQMDQGKRNFKRQEHEHEWEQEKAYSAKLAADAAGPWYIRIDGRIYRQGGQPKVFDLKKGANNYALAMIKNNPALQGKVMLTKSAEDK
jgi:hypothetical protein